MASVLVVEDDPQVAGLVSRVLEMDGHDSVVARNGVSALEEVARRSFDICLLDVLLPRLNGFEVLEQLRAEPATAAMPVVMLTGSGGRADLQHGADDHISKPFTIDELRAVVARQLAR